MSSRRQASSPLRTAALHGLGTRAAVVLLAATAATFLLLPVVGMLARAPWSSMGSALGSNGALTAMRLSLETATSSLAVALGLGLPLAWILARSEFPGRSFVRSVVTLPMVLPPVVGGIALLYAFGLHGILGSEIYRLTGWRFVFNTSGAVMAETFVSMPFLVITAESALRNMDRRPEEAAATLGASSAYRFFRVTLPAVAPALAAGAALTWARALGEFGATITFAGNLPGSTQTAPLFVYLDIEAGSTPSAVAVSVVMLAISLAILVALRDRWLTSR